MFWLITGVDVLVHHGKEDMKEQSSLLPVPRKWVVVVVVMVRSGKKKLSLQAFSFPLLFHLEPHLGDSAAHFTFRDGFPLSYFSSAIPHRHT